MKLLAPFPYFGGKSRIADLVWERLGDVDRYIEPFFGSGAVLLLRPTTPKVEIVNDIDAMLVNFWRSIKYNPKATAEFADWPVLEIDLHTRNAWLINQVKGLEEALRADPNFYDPKIAGWWVWGMSAWIGGGWCKEDKRCKPILSHLHGLNAQSRRDILTIFEKLSERLRYVLVCNGDWSRVLTPIVLNNDLTGIFLDPPYDQRYRDTGLYPCDTNPSNAVRDWAIANGDNPLLRMALCGYEGEHQMPPTWDVVSWKPAGGYGLQADGRGRENRLRERIWFSPHCLGGRQLCMFSNKEELNDE
jgi:DNA adenine methylase